MADPDGKGHTVMARTAAAAAKTGPARKTAAGKKTAPATSAPAPVKKAAAAKAPAKKTTTAAKTPAKTAAKAPAKKTTSAKAPAEKTTTAKAPARKATAGKATAKAATAAKAARKSPAVAVAPTKAPARKGASLPAGWSTKEMAAVRADLEGQLAQMRADYAQAMKALDDLQTQGADSAGDDQADAGSKTFEREHEMSLANNRRDLIVQLEHAVERIDASRYGLCESCGNAITKARLQAFPGATLCVTCKQREERR